MVTTRTQTYADDQLKFEEIPSYNLDLDLPPRQRWKHIIANYPGLHPMILSIVSQFLDGVGVPKVTKPAVKVVMSGLLSKLASDELTQELEGISEITGCPMWALVAYNIGYDFMAGCSSGGLKTVGEDGKEEMFHYRTLDWHMPETRQTTIKVNYTRGRKTVMEAIHYAGMVGIHTGVRQGLSASLNFRGHTNPSNAFYTIFQQALSTALGRRPDSLAILREALQDRSLQDLDSLIEKLKTTPAAPASGSSAHLIKSLFSRKDYTSAKVTVSDKFIPCANHDEAVEDWTKDEFYAWAAGAKDPLFMSTIARKQCAIDSSHHVKNVQDLKTLTQTWPVLNAMTTFGVIMSPERGTIDWGAWYKEPPVPPAGMEQWGGEFTPAV